MVQKRQDENCKKNNNELVIKVPVYTTNTIKIENGLFDDICYSELVNIIKAKIDSYEYPIDIPSRNKTVITVLDSVNYKDAMIGDVPCLLLNISSYKTNLYNGYFENTEKIAIQKENKIGDDSNYVLFYPRIEGYSKNSYLCYFLMLVYEDPTKESGSVSRLAKKVCSEVLKQPIQNLKLPVILSELNKIGTIPELYMKYYGIRHDDDSTPLKYRCYLQSSSVKKDKEAEFKNIPSYLVEDIFKDVSESENYSKKEALIKIGKIEYKIKKKQICEASDEFRNTSEKIFNETVPITKFELDHKLYDTELMLEKMTKVIISYLSA